MILVRNRQQLLNGNKLLALFSILVLMASCSQKVTKPVVVKEQPAQPSITKPVNKFTQANLSVFIPFKLNTFNLKTLTKAQVSKADMPLDFYQGLLQGLDSAAQTGLNFKVNVFDSRDDNKYLSSLLQNEAVKNSNLWIGPVFPDGVKFMSTSSIARKIPMVSPLAASKPSEFNNPQLISVVNNIEQHGEKIADYIAKHYDADEAIVVLINTKKSSDEQFAAPIRERFEQRYKRFVVQEFASTFAFETKMQKGKRYAVVLCADDSKFVTPSLTKLYKLKTVAGYPIQLYGHPNWLKQTYNTTYLQTLQTVITTSYFINYKDKDVINFIKKYREKYQIEPSEYAFKGFDIGFYFGNLLAKYGLSYVDYLAKNKYKGLHNDFDFVYDAQTGFSNQHLKLLQYKDLAIIPIN